MRRYDDKNYYEILSVSPNATQEEIKQAWIFCTKAFHPDKFSTSSKKHQETANDRTQDINQAYEVLSDPKERANYDRERARQTRTESDVPSPSPPPRAPPPPDGSADRSRASGNRPHPRNAQQVGLYVGWLAAAAVLVYAVIEKHPYSFYTLLRWVCCPVFAFSAVSAFEMNRVAWTWIFGVLAALYNPIFRVHLDRNTWVGVNWFTIGAIAVAAVLFWRNKKQSSTQSGER